MVIIGLKGQGMKTGTTTRLAIAGLGLIGLRHAEAIGLCDGVELCAVVDPSDQAQEKAKALGVACYTDLPSMLRAAQPDGIIQSTPTNLHVKQGLECVAAGIPCLIEKPLADNLTDAEKLVDAADANGTPLMVGHHRRFNPIIQKAKAILSDQKIGDLRAVHAKCWFYKPDDYFDIAPWRKQKGAGPISVNIVHDIDLLRHFCGEITQVQAIATPSLRGYENEDLAAAVLKFANGAIGTVTVSDSIASPWSWEFTSRENPAYPFTAQSTYQIGGSDGSLSIPDLTIWKHEGKRDWWAPMSASSNAHEASDPLINQIKHFAEVIHGQAQPLVSGREGLRTLAVIEAIHQAAETNQTIQITDQHGKIRLAGLKTDSNQSPPTKPHLTQSAQF